MILFPVHHLPSAGDAPARGRSTPAWLNLIREAVESADYGTVQIKVHGGEVVQIETTRARGGQTTKMISRTTYR